MSDKSNKPSRREVIRQRQRRQQTGTRSIFIVAAVIVAGFVAYFVWLGAKPPPEPVGLLVDPMQNSDHVADGTDVDYSTSPPTSGPHYSQPLPAGFYSPGDILVPFPESHIVHSLEHGYVAIWYNCSTLAPADCDQLKSDIQAVLDDVGGDKVIVYPWTSIEEPLAMTSWGAILRLPVFDVDSVAGFVISNRSNERAPEPFVP